MSTGQSDEGNSLFLDVCLYVAKGISMINQLHGILGSPQIYLIKF